jgi:hypothetical protein
MIHFVDQIFVLGPTYMHHMYLNRRILTLMPSGCQNFPCLLRLHRVCAAATPTTSTPSPCLGTTPSIQEMHCPSPPPSLGPCCQLPGRLHCHHRRAREPHRPLGRHTIGSTPPGRHRHRVDASPTSSTYNSSTNPLPLSFSLLI